MLQRFSNPIASGGNVQATLLVSVPGSSAQAVEIPVTVELEVAQQIVAGLHGPIEIANRNQWAGR
jgi:hypothetical protein